MQYMLSLLGFLLLSIACQHAVYISQPERVAKVIEEAARAIKQ